MIAATRVSAYPLAVASFGENLRALRQRANLTQEDVMRALDLKRSAPVSLMEAMRGTKVPRPATIKKVAAAVKAEPWELLEGVETEIDRLRKPSDLLRHGDQVNSLGEETQGNHAARFGTKPASGTASLPRKAPHAEARVRSEDLAALQRENQTLRASLDAVAAAIVGLGTAETPARHSVAARKPARRRRARKGA